MSARSSRPRMWFSARAVSTNVHRAAVRHLGGRRHPLGRLLDRVDRVVRAHRVVLDGPAGQPDGERLADRLGRRRPGRRRSRSRGRRSRARRRPRRWRRRWRRPPRGPSIRPGRPRVGGRSAARGAQRLEAERLEQLGGADVPRVRREQRLARTVEGEEVGGARGGVHRARLRPTRPAARRAASHHVSVVAPSRNGLGLVVVGEHAGLEPEALEVAHLPVRAVVRVGVPSVEHVVVVHELHVARAELHRQVERGVGAHGVDAVHRLVGGRRRRRGVGVAAGREDVGPDVAREEPVGLLR